MDFWRPARGYPEFKEGEAVEMVYKAAFVHGVKGFDDPSIRSANYRLVLQTQLERVRAVFEEIRKKREGSSGA